MSIWLTVKKHYNTKCTLHDYNNGSVINIDYFVWAEAYGHHHPVEWRGNDL